MLSGSSREAPSHGLTAAGGRLARFPPDAFPARSFPRLVLSRFEFEGVSSGESALEAGEDEEEVWLFWRDSSKETRSKSVRELAQDAKEGQKEDRDVLSYYR